MDRNPFICSCGCSTFFGHQVVHMDIKVNGFGAFEENMTPDSPLSDIYYAGDPFGPFECTNCRAEYENLY